MTELVYLDNTYLFESDAEFLEVGESDRGFAVILDQTIFYPQGGGQPTDTGKIFSDVGVFNVTSVALDEDGRVWHFGEYIEGSFKEGEKVRLEIDEEKRILNARLHLAGHLIDHALTKLGLSEKLIPTKGFHFPKGTYCEFEGVLENPSEYKEEIEREANDLVQQDVKVIKKTLLS